MSGMCDSSVNKIPKTKIICISGYSGSGKTTMMRLMQKYLPDSYYITKDEEMTRIQNPKELENIYGITVNTDNVIDYFREVAVSITNTANAYTDIATDKKYLELIAIYFEEKYNERFTEILSNKAPQFIILEWISIPQFKIWKKADYRIMVKPAKWELLAENLEKRENRIPVTPEITKARYLSNKEIIESAEDITHEIINNYDDEYEQAIRNLCNEIVSKSY